MNRNSAAAATRKKGAAPQCHPKDIINMKHTESAVQAQLVMPFVSEGVAKLNPAQANMILRECAYDHQRPINQMHVLTLAEHMKRGTWQPKDKLDFASLPDGKMILINGYHRMTAQVHSAKDIVWMIVVHDCPDHAAVRALYYRFDTNVRARSSENILQGVGFIDDTGMTKQLARRLFEAVPLIMSGLKIGTSKTTDQQKIAARIADDRLEVAREYAPFAMALAELLHPAPFNVREKLRVPAFLATAMITVKHQPELAKEFWHGMALNDGLSRSDPRAVLLRDINERTTRTGPLGTNAVIVAKAWSAFYSRRQIQLIRVTRGEVIRLLGTPYSVGV